MNGHGLRNTSSPKFTVPHVSEQESGAASSTASRASSGSRTLPPVESWTTRLVLSRSAATVASSRPRSSVGRACSSRMCTWTSAAPAASQAFASATSSSSVVGS